jgi:hypothetical protein
LMDRAARGQNESHEACGDDAEAEFRY